MILLPGTAALSDFRLRKLEKSLNKEGLVGAKLASYWVYWLKAERALQEDELQLLKRLVNGDESQQGAAALAEVNLSDDPSLIVAPRIGTITPWSSKATDILQYLDLPIARIERGQVFLAHWQHAYEVASIEVRDQSLRRALVNSVLDPLTQTGFNTYEEGEVLFAYSSEADSNAHSKVKATLKTIPITTQGRQALKEANTTLGLALSEDEMTYLFKAFSNLNRDPTDVELMMFAQVNSEHCRHKIFNAQWEIDGKAKEQSLFSMIRHTSKAAPEGLLSAYEDNAAVIEATKESHWFYPNAEHQAYQWTQEPSPMLIKVETHNHPTAISPFSGSATGSGGEIRDEGATGRGGKPKAGLTGFSVSNLQIPGFEQVWEFDYGYPKRIQTALQIMIDAPIGAAAYNNEFGRPNLCGYFRTFEQRTTSGVRGYHKPIMIAGGYGNIRPSLVDKAEVPVGSKVIVLGGPGMLIGLGGGSASSSASGQGDETLDIASVQRGNPEMERRCQEVIDRCWQLGEKNPILFIHDVGAGGLSNALPELVKDALRGGDFLLDAIPVADAGLSPLEIWCNESQERYVLAVKEADLPRFVALCERERCPYAVVGTADGTDDIQLSRKGAGKGAGEENAHLIKPVDLPKDVLFGASADLTLAFSKSTPVLDPLSLPETFGIGDALTRVLRHPTVASKKFLITIGDRTIGGQVVRDQMVGRWQEPVSDYGMTTANFKGYSGECMAMGERTPLALISPAAAAKMAVGEALTNLAGVHIGDIQHIKLSANWMAAMGEPGEDQALYEAVSAVGLELCPELGIAIPVGKDSLSMCTRWQEQPREEMPDNEDQVSKKEVVSHGEATSKKVSSPLSLIISAFSPVKDVRKAVTPEMNVQTFDHPLYLIDLSRGKHRLGGSILAQVHEVMGDECPDVESAVELRNFFMAMQQLIEESLVLAYHDRSDGGLITTLLEMAFVVRCGLNVDVAPFLAGLESEIVQTAEAPLDTAAMGRVIAALFNEELGGVIQVRKQDISRVQAVFASYDLADVLIPIAAPSKAKRIRIHYQGKNIYQKSLHKLLSLWSETSYRMQSLRDHPASAREEFDVLSDESDPGLNVNLPEALAQRLTSAPAVHQQRPRVAILREQGVNGQVEMAAAFDLAGFEVVDVHMNDLIQGHQDLISFQGMVACGGFSFGDVLGAGRGWANTIQYHSKLRDIFEHFFHRQDTFSLGVCNGCQMLSQVSTLIPGAAHWPRFERNLSEQFESRLSLVEVYDSTSILFTDMAGAQLPIAVAHGEGRVEHTSSTAANRLKAEQQLVIGYVDHKGRPTERYPFNPNGSPQGGTGYTSADGRATILMPHPERLFRAVQHSWCPSDWQERTPWTLLFENARRWVD